MEITERLHTTSRKQWRDWLTENHSAKREIWISTTKSPDGLQYLDAVEEALCFGWIDSTIKAGEGGRTFGAVSSKEIANAYKEQCGITIDKKKIQLQESIKSFGVHEVKIKLHPKVTGTLKVKVKEQ